MKTKVTLLCAIASILLITITPTIAETTTLEITNISLDTYNFTYQQLAEMPKTTLYAELYCYGSLVNAGNWVGIQLSYLLTQTNTTSEVNSIQFTASDGYTVTIPIQVAMMPETIIAYQKNGDPLPDGLRLVLPGVNGASWISKIVSLTMSNMGIDPPAAAGGGLLKDDILANLNDYAQTYPTPTITPKRTEPTPKPTPHNSTLNPIAPPANIADPTQKPQQQTAQNQSIRLDVGAITVITLIATVFVIGLVIAAIFTHKSRTKLKDKSPTTSK